MNKSKPVKPKKDSHKSSVPTVPNQSKFSISENFISNSSLFHNYPSFCPISSLADIKDKKVSVLVLCANGATSGMLANAIAEGAKQKNMNLESTAMAYGQHKEVLDQFDLIILAPQMASMLDELKAETDKAGIKSVSTGGKEYVGLTRNPEEALKFALKNI